MSFLLAILNVYLALCVFVGLLVTENYKTSTTLCGTVAIFPSTVQLTTIAVHMYPGRIHIHTNPSLGRGGIV